MIEGFRTDPVIVWFNGDTQLNSLHTPLLGEAEANLLLGINDASLKASLGSVSYFTKIEARDFWNDKNQIELSFKLIYSEETLSNMDSLSTLPWIN